MDFKFVTLTVLTGCCVGRLKSISGLIDVKLRCCQVGLYYIRLLDLDLNYIDKL